MRILTLAWGDQSARTLYAEILRLREENKSLRAALGKVDLQHAKATRDLCAHFLEAVAEEGGEALRDGIAAGLSDLNDHVARLEEHSGI